MKADMTLRVLMAQKFKEHRTKAKLSQEDVAYAIKLSRVSVANIEAGTQGLTSDVIFKCSVLFKCSVADIFPNQDEYTITLRSRISSLEQKRIDKIKRLEKELEALKSEVIL
jgi:DNA-binding XRE family transcriptional regulator